MQRFIQLSSALIARHGQRIPAMEKQSLKSYADGMHTWNLFVLYFGVWTLQKKAFSNQNRGHLGSR